MALNYDVADVFLSDQYRVLAKMEVKLIKTSDLSRAVVGQIGEYATNAYYYQSFGCFQNFILLIVLVVKGCR